MKILNRVKYAFLPENEEVTEEILDYYEKHPDELDLIINQEHFNVVFLGFFFVTGILIAVGARVLEFIYGDQLGEFVNKVILDMFAELGIAIFGGAVIAYFIEFLNKKTVSTKPEVQEAGKGQTG